MTLFPIEFIHLNELKFSVISEVRIRGCQSLSKLPKKLKLNRCALYCFINYNQFRGATCTCDEDLCNDIKIAFNKSDCSKGNGKLKHQMSMPMEAPYDGVQ